MTFHVYQPKKFNADHTALIDTANTIISEYQEMGYRMTLRQLYYRMLDHGAFPNSKQSYKKLGTVLGDARLAGLVDWDAIEDRLREPVTWPEFSGLEHLVDVACNSYRLPRHEGQENYVELWVEKDAIASILQPIASSYHVTLQVNRGYSSLSAMHESAMRFLKNTRDNDKAPILLYLGDHDPSGEDMVRDVGDRLRMFGVDDINVSKVALTIDQVEEHSLPPNPTKTSDSRAIGYIEKFGHESWEVDALRPPVLQEIIETALDQRIDVAKIKKFKAQEKVDKDNLRKAVKVILRAAKDKKKEKDS